MCSSSGELMRAGIVEDSGRKCRGEIRWDTRWKEKPKNRKREEREMLLDRLLLIRGCLAPHHYVTRNPFSFAQICLEFFLFSLTSIIRPGNQISLWLFYGSACQHPPPTPTHASNASGLELSWPFVNLGPPTMHTTTAALWNNSVMAQPQRSHTIRFAHAAHKHVSLSVTRRASQVIALLEE